MHDSPTRAPSTAGDLTAAATPDDTAAIARAAEVLRGRRVAVLSGAGVSTDSGIPDYRGRGAPVRTPMAFERFRDDPAARQRYWAGSHLGWRRFHAAKPNAGHVALSELERGGIVSGIVTQNVDDLHLRAGSRRVIELHGTLGTVSCLSCGQSFARQAIATRLDELNPWLAAAARHELAPDGDVDVADFRATVVPDCTVCGGMLKPDVVFFGETVPPATFRAAAALVRGSEVLLIAGSSLVVNSGIRIVEVARRRHLPIVIINRGATKADDRATVRIEGGTSQVLSALRDQLLD
ncbi:MAG TPA: Sir2 family NAD-dependent protein deacetylase [Microbacteriaceae bacterium]|nr:Sir2 family NAD-dependent protein deacetylase [Microbacteriaceae bacterium]